MSLRSVVFSLFALLLLTPWFVTADDPPAPGLHAYVRAHANVQNPPQLLGGPLKIKIHQERGSTRFVLPGPRFLDPSVFGTPDSPVGFDPAPFPLVGISLDLRKTMNGNYTFVDHATPFSNWHEVGVGDLKLELLDATATDGARTKDKIDFVAEFQTPDKKHTYKVVCKTPLSHGFAFPVFGGVATNHLLHGVTGIGTRLMPSEFTYAAFWGVGKIFKDGKLINDNHMIHGMLTEIVRGDNYALQFDGGVGDPPQGMTFHLMVPPYSASPEGPVHTPLRTGFLPFPFVKKHMEATMAMVKALPPAQREEKLAVLMEVKELMGHTKEHVMHAMKEGKMDGQPWFHVMFGNVEVEAKRK